MEAGRATGRTARVTDIVEKPGGQAPARLAVVGRYLLTPAIFDCLESLPPGTGGEIQLTDAIARLCRSERVFAYSFCGRRFDCGSKLGYLAATVHFALEHPEVGDAFGRLLAATRARTDGAATLRERVRTTTRDAPRTHPPS